MKKAAPKQLDNLMNLVTGLGQKFFDCDIVNVYDNYDPYTGRCPVHYDSRDLLRSKWELEYTLRDEQGFYAALSNQTRLDEAAIEFGDKTDSTDCYDAMG
jgi:hypothetical protein